MTSKPKASMPAGLINDCATARLHLSYMEQHPSDMPENAPQLTQQAIDSLRQLIHIFEERGERLGATNLRLAIERLEQLTAHIEQGSR